MGSNQKPHFSFSDGSWAPRELPVLLPVISLSVSLTHDYVSEANEFSLDAQR